MVLHLQEDLAGEPQRGLIAEERLDGTEAIQAPQGWFRRTGFAFLPEASPEPVLAGDPPGKVVVEDRLRRGSPAQLPSRLLLDPEIVDHRHWSLLMNRLAVPVPRPQSGAGTGMVHTSGRRSALADRRNLNLI